MTTIRTVSIRSISNGYLVTVTRINNDPMTVPEEYAYESWAEVTTFLAQEEFIPVAPEQE
jgi:hypothetical protein